MIRIKWAALSLILLLLLPVAAGTLSVFGSALGYAPALDSYRLTLTYINDVISAPEFLRIFRLTLTSGMISTLLAVMMTIMSLAYLFGRNTLLVWNRAFRPLLVIPHAAAAIAFGFLLAPSGLAIRMLSPQFTGFELPPSWPIPNDQLGIIMTLALALKEMPFLLLMASAIILQPQRKQRFTQQLRVAGTLGYSPFAAFVCVIWPQLYPLIRLPIFAVLVFTGSSIEIPLILGPSSPSTNAVTMLTALNDVDLGQRFTASSMALVQIGLSAVSVALWIGLEALGRMLQTGLRQANRANRVFFFAQPLTQFILLTSLMLLMTSLIALMILSVSGHWPFSQGLPSSFTLIHWQFALSQLQTPIINTLLIGVGVSMLSVLLCVVTLESLAGHSGMFRYVTLANYIPLFVPMVVFMYGAATLLMNMQLVSPALRVGILHFVIVTPYVWLSLAQQYNHFDPRLISVARSLGASTLKCFFALKLPLMWSTFMAALSLGISISFSQYLPTLLGGAGEIQTLTTEAVALASGGSRRLTAVYGLLQIALPLVVFALFSIHKRHEN